MATDPIRREASRDWISAKNAERREEVARLAESEDLVTSGVVAAELAVSFALLQYYERHGLLVPRRVTVGGLSRRLYRGADVERFKREWRSGGDYRRAQWMNEQFLLTVYEGRGLTARLAEETGLPLEEVRDVFRGRLRRRLARYPEKRPGRKPSLPAAPHPVVALVCHTVRARSTTELSGRRLSRPEAAGDEESTG